MRELAIAGGSVDYGAVMAGRARVLSAERCILHAPVLLFHIRLVVPTQAVIESQLAADLPAILGKETEGVIAQLGVGGRIEIQDVGQTRKEAGVGKTGRVRRD